MDLSFGQRRRDCICNPIQLHPEMFVQPLSISTRNSISSTSMPIPPALLRKSSLICPWRMRPAPSQDQREPNQTKLTEKNNCYHQPKLIVMLALPQRYQCQLSWIQQLIPRLKSESSTQEQLWEEACSHQRAGKSQTRQIQTGSGWVQSAGKVYKKNPGQTGLRSYTKRKCSTIVDT